MSSSKQVEYQAEEYKIKVDLNDLINEIYIRLYAESYYYEIDKSLLEVFLLDKKDKCRFSSIKRDLKIARIMYHLI